MSWDYLSFPWRGGPSTGRGFRAALKNKKQEQKKVTKVSHKEIIIIFSAKVVFTFIRGKPKTHSLITVGSDIHYPREASKTSSTAPFREM